MIRGQTCPSCGVPFGSAETLAHSPGYVCGRCRQSPPDYDQALSIGYFEGPLREAIHQFKYGPCRSLGRHLSEWMIGNLRFVSELDLVVPVPLHKKRLRQRGFNQALMLAHGVSRAKAIPLSFDNLVRIRATRPQVELSAEERVKNVAGAFALKRPKDVKGKRALIIDDVFTTGATMNECAAVLKKAGASGVIALTLARPA